VFKLNEFDLNQIADALADQSYEHRWFIDPHGDVVPWMEGLDFEDETAEARDRRQGRVPPVPE
jgi:hypothetical protein